jgi:hypothetical protein
MELKGKVVRSSVASIPATVSGNGRELFVEPAHPLDGAAYRETMRMPAWRAMNAASVRSLASSFTVM